MVDLSYKKNKIFGREIIYGQRILLVEKLLQGFGKICSPLEEGGLGVRSLCAINYATLSKLYWDMISSHQH